MDDTTATPPRNGLDRLGLLHLMVVYVVWGSTYLGIRIAVMEGSGFPPFMMAGLRVVAASAILLTWAKLKGERIRLHGGEWVLLAGSGLLLWIGGNGLVTWAEMRASSGLAALLVAAMPIWGEAITMILDRRAPSAKAAASIALGFLGVGLLTWPVLRTGVRADVMAVTALLLAPLFWSMGSIWFQRHKTDLGVIAASGWQQLLGGAGMFMVALGRGEPVPTPTGQAWAAWAYLTVFGSVIAFTSYMTTLRRLPYRVVMTYAYANPVIAVCLGWLVLGEAVTVWTLAGAGLVVAGVAGIFNNRD
ncbi:MAG: EamA family transporter [bacterium]|nr:EamA family transporter [bacterium]